MTRLRMESTLILNVVVQRDDKKLYVIVDDPQGLIMHQPKELSFTLK